MLKQYTNRIETLWSYHFRGSAGVEILVRHDASPFRAASRLQNGEKSPRQARELLSHRRTRTDDWLRQELTALPSGEQRSIVPFRLSVRPSPPSSLLGVFHPHGNITRGRSLLASEDQTRSRIQRKREREREREIFQMKDKFYLIYFLQSVQKYK